MVWTLRCGDAEVIPTLATASVPQSRNRNPRWCRLDVRAERPRNTTEGEALGSLELFAGGAGTGLAEPRATDQRGRGRTANGEGGNAVDMGDAEQFVPGTKALKSEVDL